MRTLYILEFFLLLPMTLIIQSQAGKSIVVFILYMKLLHHDGMCPFNKIQPNIFTLNKIALGDIKQL